MKGKIALFLHQPYCSVQSGNGIMNALGRYYNFKIFTRHTLEADFFDDVDMIAVPGGIGDADSFEFLMRENGPRIKQFVQQGGAYLGICMGAYWAGSEYFDLLDNLDAVQYITRPKTDTRRPHAKNLTVTWKDRTEQMFFYDGCAIVGQGHCRTIARYANGDRMAVIQDRIGLIGCHPESESHWYNDYSWMRGKYHQGSQHDLLLNFVDSIINK